MILYVLLVMCLPNYCLGNDIYNEETITYYENLIRTATENALNYQFDTNAYRYKPKDKNKRICDGVYDFIIVGSGSAGSVLANRLSEIGSWRILLLEAGTYGNNLTDIPAYASRSDNSDYNWGFLTVPQKNSCLGQKNKKCLFTRGRGIGGSSLINGLAYTRGNPLDFDKWAELGNPGWSYQEVLPYFKKSEHINKNNPKAIVDFEYHGKHGELNVEFQMPQQNPYYLSFIKANQELGYSLIDYNSEKVQGTSPFQKCLKNGRRFDNGKAFVRPIRKRTNLVISTKSYVTKVIINSKRLATGVHFSRNGVQYYAKARREVILSAGAINSPQLLMLSGIGPRNHLKKIGISVVRGLEVGTGFTDQPSYSALLINTNVTVPHLHLRQTVLEYLQGHMNAGPTALTFYQSKLEKIPNNPDIEIALSLGDTINNAPLNKSSWIKEVGDAMSGADSTKTFTLSVINLRPKSEGTIRLKSSDPYEYPNIDVNLFAKKVDYDILYEGIKFTLKLLETDAMRKINATIYTKPIKFCEQYKFMSKNYLYCAMRYFSEAYLHPIGSCRMGPDPRNGGVVDNNLRVHGIRNLRVADCSVIPVPISGHTHAPCTMVGEKAADIIKADNI